MVHGDRDIVTALGKENARRAGQPNFCLLRYLGWGWAEQGNISSEGRDDRVRLVMFFVLVSTVQPDLHKDISEIVDNEDYWDLLVSAVIVYPACFENQYSITTG